ncbi:MAG: hypothetical protein R2793_00365 [Flavobacteriaceae bacterium]
MNTFKTEAYFGAIQYLRKLVTNALSPLFHCLSRRVRATDEEAVVQFLAPNHPVLNSPNKITTGF